MAQSEAQRKAAERNLKKGNPNAFSKGPPRDSGGSASRDLPGSSQGASQGGPGKKKTYRGAGSQGAPREPPRKQTPRSQGPPREKNPENEQPDPATEPDPASSSTRSETKGGLIDDVIGSIFG